ncbi:hypothetical protein ACFSKI_17795 [Pseudogracilibacillus auburnensis]|uniref:Uncharacterized protein n=1 Tax=Pseudogracilibacillus auburnensis TaxID=1494959 RepID=A0A2V3W2M2_9BACI|nr:hypothetical protein [Pseudogracilibacillus auburnensis]PXW88547.1 hypothetical protein DFR56_10352 [Pseudogracilibacillus auburnensis]
MKSFGYRGFNDYLNPVMLIGTLLLNTMRKVEMNLIILYSTLLLVAHEKEILGIIIVIESSTPKVKKLYPTPKRRVFIACFANF